METVDWSQLSKHRTDVRRRYPSIWSLPIEPRYSDVLFAQGLKPQALLEIGAGDRDLMNKVARRWPGCRYLSFDIDRSYDHDFYALDEIAGEYDLVCMFEVIEHLTPHQALVTLERCREVLRPGGHLLITTPNVYYPPAYLRDATHITPWCYHDLGGIASMAGFEVRKIYRLYKESLLERLVRRYLAYPLFRLVGIDFAKQIILVATKPV